MCDFPEQLEGGGDLGAERIRRLQNLRADLATVHRKRVFQIVREQVLRSPAHANAPVARVVGYREDRDRACPGSHADSSSFREHKYSTLYSTADVLTSYSLDYLQDEFCELRLL